MQHILKQPHYLGCQALELLCNSLCGPLTKKFGEKFERSSVRATFRGVVGWERVGTHSHTFFALIVTFVEYLDFSFQFVRAADSEN